MRYHAVADFLPLAQEHGPAHAAWLRVSRTGPGADGGPLTEPFDGEALAVFTHVRRGRGIGGIRLWRRPSTGHHRAMQWSDDIGQIGWIRDRLDEFNSGRITSVVPAGFEAYARVLHPVSQNGEHGPVRWRDVAAWTGVRLTPETSFDHLASLDPGPSGPPEWPGAPKRGSLPSNDARALVDVLGEHTAPGEPCWFAVWDGWGWVWGGVTSTVSEVTAAMKAAEPPIPREVVGGPRAELPGRSYLLFTGNLDDALTLVEVDHIWMLDDESPNLWWPADRSWCVATEIDLESTYVGGPATLIDRLVSEPRLEALPVTTEDEIV